MIDVADIKRSMRENARRTLAELDPHAAHLLSVSACERIINTESFISSLCVMVYLPMSDELDITPVALRAFQLGKTVCAPRIDWERKRMTPVEVRGFDDRFEIRQHEVREPLDGLPIALSEIDLILTPGLAFDVSGRRLGRGGGFYDRFLAQPGFPPRLTRCGVCFDSQIVEAIPTGVHDATLDAVVTDRRVIRVPTRKHA